MTAHIQQVAKLCGVFAPIITLGLLGSFFVSCQEKQATPKVAKPTNTNDGADDDTGKDDEDGDEDGGKDGGKDDGKDDGGAGTDPTSFDLCKTAKTKITDSTASTLLTELCGKMSSLRSNNMFKGTGEPNPSIEETVQGDMSSFHVLSALSVASKPEDYFAMVKLQYLKPPKFKETFEVGSAVDLNVESASDKSAAFEYTNSAVEESIVKYRAKTDFIVIKDKQAYAFVTKFIEKKETLEALTGLIIINKKSTAETEVYSISDQKYNNSGEPATCKSNVTRELKNEQKRSWNNGKNASKAPPLLTGG